MIFNAIATAERALQVSQSPAQAVLIHFGTQTVPGSARVSNNSSAHQGPDGLQILLVAGHGEHEVGLIQHQRGQPWPPHALVRLETGRTQPPLLQSLPQGKLHLFVRKVTGFSPYNLQRWRVEKINIARKKNR